MSESWDRFEGRQVTAETAKVLLPERDRFGVGLRQSPYLLVIQGPSMGVVHKLSGRRTLVGRSSDSDLLVDDEGVSRQHAVVERTAKGAVIVDLDSLNGVYVNGRRVRRHTLRNGDRVRLGTDSVLKFSVQDEFEESFQQQLYKTSVRDGLTGAYNKRFFSEQIKTEFAYAIRHKVPLSLLILDIDRFERVNESYGHQMGDYVLREVVRLIRPQLRTEDVLSRHGGEEFTVILRQTGNEEAILVAERLRRLVASHIFGHEGASFTVTISVGAATLSSGTYADTSDLLATADSCLFEAKRSGRNAVAGEVLSKSGGEQGDPNDTKPV